MGLQQEPSATTSTIAERLALFACEVKVGDAPALVLERVKACLIHAIMVGAAGMDAPFGMAAERAMGPGDPELRAGRSRSLITGDYHSPPIAAFINASLFHARAQEDTHGTFHPGITVIPAALAAAESKMCDGKTFMDAVLAGYEVGTALSAVLTERTTPPFRATAVFGAVAAAAAVGKILQLSTEQMASAIAIAAASSGGTSESFGAGTDEWRFQPAKAAMNGFMAATLAVEGVHGSKTAIEGPAGFLECFAGIDAEDLTTDLGNVWNILGVTFKPYPVCAFNQAPSLLGVQMRSEGLRAETVESITLRMNEREATYPGMPFDGPFQTVAQTLMSARFAFATALVHGDITLASLQEFETPEVMEMVGKIKLVADSGRPAKTAKATAHLADGSVLERAIEETDSLLSWSLRQVVARGERMRSESNLSADQYQLLVRSINDLAAANDVREVVSAAISAQPAESMSELSDPVR
ncbi:mmgE/PrpD family protein [Pseudarthrobacter siccitolerans]|uniref:MmgE/PrpD family protein n=1 Tax=Pseudarthrobacter siccitolerans TaxID=861266 RepID=A0A024H2M6_9MICC|nr:MmgE/PrpD family protein [Pseudarthrobacter siccitolerans]CCQ46142.1 mmgE/PrpD family protein [Pseudarthrobacter siccitolerans]